MLRCAMVCCASTAHPADGDTSLASLNEDEEMEQEDEVPTKVVLEEVRAI